MRRVTLSAIVLLALLGLPSFARDNQATTLSVRAVAYRAIPHEATSSYTTPGYRNTYCYGSGNGSATDWGYMTTINMSFNTNCQTVTTPPKEYTNTRRTMEAYNLVEANGMAYTIRCTANWIASSCNALTPGDYFSAEVKDTTPWITAREGGNTGKEVHAKFRIVDIRPMPSVPRAQSAAPVANPAPTPVQSPQLATPAVAPTSTNTPASRDAAVVTIKPTPAPIPVPTTNEADVQPMDPEAKLVLTVTSDPSGAAVEINGVSVGTTPVTVPLAKGTKFELAVRKEGYVPWVAVANYGKFTMNANLTREVFR
jgi:hypothetical protein